MSVSIVVDIEKKLGSFHLKLAFEAGNEVLGLLGASGCGKSVTLCCIAGILTPDRGRIVLDGVTLFDSERKINLPPQKRGVGLLFQNYALFPNMTVLENLRAGCRRNWNKAESERKLREIMELFELTPLQKHLPAQLSGGQQQRTALARILLSEPNILLLDEPFSALDAHLRFRLEQELAQVVRRFGKTVLLVSHDRDQVYRLSHQVLVMHNGEKEVCGSREEVYRNPRTYHAALLTGCENIAACQMISASQMYVPQWGLTLTVPAQAATPSYVGIRMQDICPGKGENTVCCDVVSETENAFSWVIMLRPVEHPDKAPFGWELDKALWARLRREQVTIHIPAGAILPCVETICGEKRNRL